MKSVFFVMVLFVAQFAEAQESWALIDTIDDNLRRFRDCGEKTPDLTRFLTWFDEIKTNEGETADLKFGDFDMFSYEIINTTSRTSCTITFEVYETRCYSVVCSSY